MSFRQSCLLILTVFWHHVAVFVRMCLFLALPWSVITWPRGYIFFMLNSTEHEISTAKIPTNEEISDGVHCISQSYT